MFQPMYRLQQYNLQAIESRQITVNGLNAIAMVADVKTDPAQQQQQPLWRIIMQIFKFQLHWENERNEKEMNLLTSNYPSIVSLRAFHLESRI